MDEDSRGNREFWLPALRVSLGIAETAASPLRRAQLGIVDRVCVVKASKDVLQPLTVEMTMVRNLSAAYYFDIPSTDLSGKMNTVSVSTSRHRPSPSRYTVVVKMGGSTHTG